MESNAATVHTWTLRYLESASGAFVPLVKKQVNVELARANFKALRSDDVEEEYEEFASRRPRSSAETSSSYGTTEPALVLPFTPMC